MSDDLEKRVEQFALLVLPGQPRMMHMGTSYLVNDLWREVQRLRESAKIDSAKRERAKIISAQLLIAAKKINTLATAINQPIADSDNVLIEASELLQEGYKL